LSGDTPSSGQQKSLGDVLANEGRKLVSYLEAEFDDTETAMREIATLPERTRGRDGGGLHDGWKADFELIKRIFDLLIAGAAIALTLPLMLLVSLLIKCDNIGPVLYRQQRVGLRGRKFVLYKFRSMRHDAEADGTPIWAVEWDPRVTRIGRFVRCTRIDELPQLLNVLRGDMSIVGPRPERPYFVDKLSAAIPFYAQRHSVSPGSLAGHRSMRPMALRSRMPAKSFVMTSTMLRTAVSFSTFAS
jgi:lipopolysaccharide/colanic/teichoic acid biosynthesis glycosyltransferase